MGEGEYIVLEGGELLRFTHWDQLPERFDNLVAFLPAIPHGPHTVEQHETIEQLPQLLRVFMQRERGYASRHANR